MYLRRQKKKTLEDNAMYLGNMILTDVIIATMYVSIYCDKRTWKGIKPPRMIILIETIVSFGILTIALIASLFSSVTGPYLLLLLFPCPIIMLFISHKWPHLEE